MFWTRTLETDDRELCAVHLLPRNAAGGRQLEMAPHGDHNRATRHKIVTVLYKQGEKDVTNFIPHMTVPRAPRFGMV